MIKGKIILTFYDDETPTVQRGASVYKFSVNGNCELAVEKSMSNIIGELVNAVHYLQDAVGEITLFPKETKQSIVSERLHDCFCLIPMIEERTKRVLDYEDEH